VRLSVLVLAVNPWTRAADANPGPERSIQVNYEEWNRYVLMAIGLFAVLLYTGLIYAGLAEFMSRISKSGKGKKRSRSRVSAPRLRNPKVPGR
jgi:hypothetical protein